MRHHIFHGIALCRRIVVVEISFIFLIKTPPLPVCRYYHPIGTVFTVDISQLVEHDILQVHHGIQVNSLPIHNLPRNTTGGIEFVHVIPTKERRDTVQIGICAEVFGHVRKIWKPTIHGKQHTVAIKFVGGQTLHSIHRPVCQIAVFAVQHHHLHRISGRNCSIIIHRHVVLQNLFDNDIVIILYPIVLLGVVDFRQAVHCICREIVVGGGEEG